MTETQQQVNTAGFLEVQRQIDEAIEPFRQACRSAGEMCQQVTYYFQRWSEKQQQIAQAVASCNSYAAVLRALNVPQGGGTQAKLKEIIKIWNIDTSHFLGQRANCGDNKKGGTQKKTGAKF